MPLPLALARRRREAHAPRPVQPSKAPRPEKAQTEMAVEQPILSRPTVFALPQA